MLLIHMCSGMAIWHYILKSFWGSEMAQWFRVLVALADDLHSNQNIKHTELTKTIKATGKKTASNI